MMGEVINILLVEDNEDHAELVRRSFGENHVANRIHHVKDGEEALEYLFRRGRYAEPSSSPVPNLVLLDLRLPKIDGMEVLKEIKSSSLRNIPVVVLTSSQAEQDIAKAYANYVNSYLVKPVDFGKFTGLMRDLGYYWLAWNTNPLSQADGGGDKDSLRRS